MDDDWLQDETVSHPTRWSYGPCLRSLENWPNIFLIPAAQENQLQKSSSFASFLLHTQTQAAVRHLRLGACKAQAQRCAVLGTSSASPKEPAGSQAKNINGFAY